jgi:thiol-disulfide isomerase/thioredoxin
MRQYFVVLCTALTLTFFSNTSRGDDKSAIFGSLSRAKHIFGPETSQEELKGKVVFLEYWGIHCPPCRASYPHLVELQKKYAKTGKFTILASHVQSFSKEVPAFLQKEGVTFPVYQQFREAKAPCGRGIPHAALIDHKGNVVAEGYPSDLYPKVAALVAAAPAPIIGSVEIKFCKSQAKALEAGRGIAGVIKSLQKLAAVEGEKGEEAKALLDTATGYLEKRKTALIEKASTKPSAALKELTAFSKQINGMECNADVKAKIAELKQDASLRKLIKFRKDIEKLNAKLAKRESSSTRKALEKLKASLQKFIDSKSTTPCVANEAKELL